ncbi:MAG: hypothetical protein ABEH77_10700 [Halobacteriaceae archaeon]
MADGEAEPVVVCDLQGGTLSVYETYVAIERTSASIFGDKRIDLADVRGVEYAPGIVSGHIQILEAGVEAGEGGLLSHPVDENTLYFPRTGRSCARRARDAILERAGGD